MSRVKIQIKLHTTLFENRGSSRFAVRLMIENALMISKNAGSGDIMARSTRLYAIAASTAGSAVRRRWRSIEMVSLVTCECHEAENRMRFTKAVTSSILNSRARHVTTEIVLIPISLFSSSESPRRPVSTFAIE